jgi:hypothetical protein
MVRWNLTTRLTILSIAATIVLTACSTPDPHSAKDYAGASAVGDPEGTFTIILGPATPIVKMTSTLKFPQGDTWPLIHSVLMYEHPSVTAGNCVFEIGYKANTSSEIVKEASVEQPCDGKQQARFRLAGVDIAFVGHLEKKDYKGTPVTLFEITDHTIPESIHLVY